MDQRTADVPGLIAEARQGRPRAVARLISLVEDEHPALREVMAVLLPHCGRAVVIGLTGPPGVGKSTATSALIGVFRGQGRRVGVLAVDPSSPFSGGALLGDRIRMHEHALDPEVFIRSMAARGHLGGLARSTPQALRVLDAAGFDVVIIETVGVGQSEVEIAALADTTLVLLAPGAGDGIQAAKAGILEVGDVFAVTKADRDGAAATARELRHMLRLVAPPECAGEATDGDRETWPTAWSSPVLEIAAPQGQGIVELATALNSHRQWLVASGDLDRRRRLRAAAEIEAIAFSRLRTRIADLGPGRRLADLAAGVLAGDMDPYAAAEALLSAVLT